MKKKLIELSFIFIICFQIISLDISTFDFMGYNLSENKESVLNKLNNKGKDYILKEAFFENKEYLIIEPKDQKIEEQKNLDYLFTIHKGKIFKIILFKIKKSDIDKLKSQLGNNFSVFDKNNSKIYTWNYDAVIINIVFKNNIYNLDITNYSILNKKISYTPTISSLRFRDQPNINSKFIRMLNVGEKLEQLEKGKSETIGEVTGTWVKVKTEQGEIGWCFDAYLKEIE